MRKTIKLISLLIAISNPTFANGIKKVSFPEYNTKVGELKSACESKGKPSFSGFCLSEDYGKVKYDSPVQTSINIAIQIAGLELFRNSCENSNAPLAENKIEKAKKVLQTTKFLEEIKSQTDALENYVGRHYPCESKSDNDTVITGRVKWLEYMSERYYSDVSAAKAAPASPATNSTGTEYVGAVGKERISLACADLSPLNSACLFRVGTPGVVQTVRFVDEPTQRSQLLKKSIEKALETESNESPLSATERKTLGKINVEKCHPAARSDAASGDIFQICIPQDPSRIVFFIRGVCDRCQFIPIVLEKAARQ